MRGLLSPRLLLLSALLLALITASCNQSEDANARAVGGGEDEIVSADLLARRLAEIRRSGDDLERAEAIASVVRFIDSQAVPVLRGEVVDRSSTWRSFDRLILLSAWARFSGEEATRWATASAPKTYRAVAIEMAMASWARNDHGAARAAFEQDHAEDSAAMAGLIAGWLESDPSSLRSYIDGLDLSSDTGQHAVAVFVRRLIEREGPTAAADWAEGRAEVWNARRTQHLFRQVASELTMAEPERGIAFCERHCEGGSGSAVRQMVATRWSQRDPAAAMAWLLTVDDANPDERKYAINAGFGNWMRLDPQRALDWASEQDPALREAPWFEPVVRRVARSLGWKRVREALEWAESIPREGERERAQIFILRRWRARDQAAAEKWISASSLSENVISAIQTANDDATRR